MKTNATKSKTFNPKVMSSPINSPTKKTKAANRMSVPTDRIGELKSQSLKRSDTS